MQAIKLVIPGAFWDSQIYSGILYLFTLDGEIVTVNWQQAVSLLAQKLEKSAFNTALRIAFHDSGLLYNERARALFQHPEVRGILKRDFQEIANTELCIEEEELERISVKNDNPFPFPHSDSEVYYRRLYVGLTKGLFSTEFQNTSSKNGSRPEKHWDGPVLDISASPKFTTIALASGGDGLYEVRLDLDKKKPLQNRAPNQVVPNHCNSCEWSYHSIYASSHVHGSFMALYDKKSQDPNNRKSRKYYREFERVISSEELFSRRGFSWGVHDKIYLYRENRIFVLEYNPRNNDMPFKHLETIPLQSWKGDMVSASAAPFGVVVELDNALVIMRSDDSIETISGEPVSWRVFPRSENYTNQLHIIYDEKLEIWSFNHDYFVDQESKLAGIKMTT